MKKKVWLKIIGTQKIDDETNTTEVITQGMYYKKNNMYYITYQESEATGFQGCKSVIKVADNKVTLIRHGNNGTNMIIENRQRNEGYYSTLFGDLMIGTTAKNILVQLDEDGGKVIFEYLLDVNNQYVSDNIVSIQVLTSNALEV